MPSLAFPFVGRSPLATVPKPSGANINPNTNHATAPETFRIPLTRSSGNPASAFAQRALHAAAQPSLRNHVATLPNLTQDGVTIPLNHAAMAYYAAQYYTPTPLTKTTSPATTTPTIPTPAPNSDRPPLATAEQPERLREDMQRALMYYQSAAKKFG